MTLFWPSLFAAHILLFYGFKQRKYRLSSVYREISRRCWDAVAKKRHRRWQTMLNRWQATKWRSLRKECCHKYVPRSGTTLFDVFDADILCGIRFSAGFAALHQRLSIVKHLRRFHRNIYNHLIVSDINRLCGQSEWFAMMFRDF